MTRSSAEHCLAPGRDGSETRGDDSTVSIQQRTAALMRELAHLREEYARQVAEKHSLALHLRTVLDGLPVAVIVLDGRGVIREHNRTAATWFGGSLLGSFWRDVIARDFRTPSQDSHDLSLNNGRIVELSTCPLGNAPGQILLFHDVTDIRQAQQALVRQQRILDLGQMAANIAHQIRTPLASALLYASHLRDSELPPEKRQRFAEKSVRSLRHLESLVANMLLFARGDAGAQQDVDAGELLHELDNQTTPLLSGTSVRVLLDDSAGASTVRINRTMILSALQNLVSNAIQAVGTAGNVLLYCRRAAANSIDFGVCDDGPGIAPDIQAQLFEPYCTNREGGTGLGLAIVRAVAHAHHGEVWFQSSPGNTTFAIRLPCLPAQGGHDAGALHEQGEVA